MPQLVDECAHPNIAAGTPPVGVPNGHNKSASARETQPRRARIAVIVAPDHVVKTSVTGRGEMTVFQCRPVPHTVKLLMRNLVPAAQVVLRAAGGPGIQVDTHTPRTVRVT